MCVATSLKNDNTHWHYEEIMTCLSHLNIKLSMFKNLHGNKLNSWCKFLGFKHVGMKYKTHTCHADVFWTKLIVDYYRTFSIRFLSMSLMLFSVIARFIFILKQWLLLLVPKNKTNYVRHITIHFIMTAMCAHARKFEKGR